MQVLNAICALTVLGFFALTVDGKHMQEESAKPPSISSVVEKYASAETAPHNWISDETPEQRSMLLKLAVHMGRR